MLTVLAASNAAQRTDLDWQAQNEVHLLTQLPAEFQAGFLHTISVCLQALNKARRLVRFHLEVVAQELQDFVALVVPAVDSLRSQIARNAMGLLQASLKARQALCWRHARLTCSVCVVMQQ